MKKILVTLLTTVACVGAFAQGKVTMVNDNNHLVYLTTDTSKLKQLDTASAGAGITAGGVLPSGVSLIAGLYAGTSSTALSFYSAQPTFVATSGGPGRISTLAILLNSPAIALGTPGVFFQVKVWDSAFGATATSYANAALASYVGSSAIFTMTTGSATSTSIVVAGTPGFSTWANGTFVPTGGGLGAIEVLQTIPEPSTLALAGLGAAAMLMFRRRK